LSLPMWSNMSAEVVMGICDTFQRIHKNAADVREKLSEK
jgi:hypothetical protein